MDCFNVDCLSGQDIFLNSDFTPSKKLGFFSADAFEDVFSAITYLHAAPGGLHSHRLRRLLFGFLVKRVGLTESAIFLGLHPVGMSFLVLGRIVVTLFALGARQSDFRTHLSTSAYLVIWLFSRRPFLMPGLRAGFKIKHKKKT